MGLSMIALGYYFYLKETTGETMEGFLLYLPIIAALSFIASFDIGLAPLAWVLNSELFPKEVKTPASTLGATLNWTFAFMVVYFYPITEKALAKYVCYFFFAGVSILGAVLIYFLVPETKGRTEEDMREYFLQKTSRTNSKPAVKTETNMAYVYTE